MNIHYYLLSTKDEKGNSIGVVHVFSLPEEKLMVTYNPFGCLTVVPEAERKKTIAENVPDMLQIDAPSGDILLRTFTEIHREAKKAADEFLGQLKHRLTTATT